MEIDQTEALLQHLAMKVSRGSPGLEGGFWSALFVGDVFLKGTMMKWKSIRFFSSLVLSKSRNHEEARAYTYIRA